MRDTPPVPKMKSILDKAKELEDYMHQKGLTSPEVRELLAIIEFSRRQE